MTSNNMRIDKRFCQLLMPNEQLFFLKWTVKCQTTTTTATQQTWEMRISDKNCCFDCFLTFRAHAIIVRRWEQYIYKSLKIVYRSYGMDVDADPYVGQMWVIWSYARSCIMRCKMHSFTPIKLFIYPSLVQTQHKFKWFFLLHIRFILNKRWKMHLLAAFIHVRTRCQECLGKKTEKTHFSWLKYENN